MDISGSISASFFVGDGSRLVNIPAAVPVLIASGSATASISPDYGFVVNTFSTISGSLIVSSSNTTPTIQ